MIQTLEITNWTPTLLNKIVGVSVGESGQAEEVRPRHGVHRIENARACHGRRETAGLAVRARLGNGDGFLTWTHSGSPPWMRWSVLECFEMTRGDGVRLCRW